VKPAKAIGGLSESRFAPIWRTPLLQPSPARVLPERNFRLGIPEHRHFPHDVWRRLMAQALRTSSRERFAYPPSEGIPALREAIAQHVAFARAVACTANDVIVTSGAQQAFDLIARLLVTPGRTRVAVEEPGYPPVRAAFAAAGAQLVPLPVDDEGLRVDGLPEDVRIISVTPSHQSPTGVAMSLRRRTALLDFARRHGAVVVEDDYDGEFRFGGRPLDALQTLDRDALVFYVGTFSKSMFPALRKGFVVAPSWARHGLITVKYCADSHCDTITQSVLAAFIRDGHLARHVRRMRSIYAERREALLAGLRRELHAWLEPIPSEAGLHLAARIRTPARAPKIMRAAQRFLPGAESTANYAMTREIEPALAFGYGVIDAGEIAAALGKMRRALQCS
jgi:GntR family transcriptional regulator/MocR family aminotransferase